MTPECQPLDISVNKKFKDNIKYKLDYFKKKLMSKITNSSFKFSWFYI